MSLNLDGLNVVKRLGDIFNFSYTIVVSANVIKFFQPSVVERDVFELHDFGGTSLRLFPEHDSRFTEPQLIQGQPFLETNKSVMF